MTKDEKSTIAKLMLVIANVFDENRKEVPIEPPHYGEKEMRPEFSLAQLRPLKDEAMAEAQVILSRKGY